MNKMELQDQICPFTKSCGVLAVELKLNERCNKDTNRNTKLSDKHGCYTDRHTQCAQYILNHDNNKK